MLRCVLHERDSGRTWGETSTLTDERLWLSFTQEMARAEGVVRSQRRGRC